MSTTYIYNVCTITRYIHIYTHLKRIQYSRYRCQVCVECYPIHIQYILKGNMIHVKWLWMIVKFYQSFYMDALGYVYVHITEGSKYGNKGAVKGSLHFILLCEKLKELLSLLLPEFLVHCIVLNVLLSIQHCIINY